MKKFINTMIIIICLCITCYASDIPEHISSHDNAGVLSSAAEKYIDLKNKELSKKCGAKIVFLTQNSTGDGTANEYAEQIFDKWGIDSIGRSNSIFILMCPDRKDYSVVVSEGISAAVTDEYAEKLLVQYMEPDFKKEKYDLAAVKTFNAFASWFNDNYNNVSLELTEDLSEYEHMVDTEKKEAQKRTFSITAVIVVAAIAIWIIAMHIRKQIRLKKLRQRRIERRKRYLKSRRPEHNHTTLRR